MRPGDHGQQAGGMARHYKAEVTVTQIHSCDNTGTNGIGQFYLFERYTDIRAPSVADIPIGLNWYMPKYNPVGILISSTEDQPIYTWTWRFHVYARTAAFVRPLKSIRLNNHFLSTVPYGCGVLRFMDSFLYFGGDSNASEPWEMREQTFPGTTVCE